MAQLIYNANAAQIPEDIPIISLSGLNDKQRAAAETIDGPVLILAGAGSGKTRTITYRTAHMVDNLGINPKSILGVSFTNKAAREMRERVQGLLSRQKARGLTLTTFHSLGVKLLKKEIEKLGYHKNFTIYDTSDQMGIVRNALKSYKAEKNFDRKIVLSKIGFLKNNGIGENEFADSEFFNDEDPYDHTIDYVYRFYQDKLKFFNAIDFDDILFLTVRLFTEFPEIAKKYSETYQYIMIDEYQDTNTLQFKLIMGLTSTHDNLCVVGDDDQSIYSFRGADISNILNFEKNFPGAKVIKLEENYRSTMPILQLANEVIKENEGRRDKTLWSKKASPATPVLWAMGNTDHEAEVVVDEIVQHQGKGGHLGDIAVLYRSKTQANPIEEQLRLSQVPYTIIGGQKFYEKKEVKDLMAYLCVLHNPKDQMSLRRILNIPNRGIGTATLNKYLAAMEEHSISLFEALERFPDLDPKRKNHITAFTELIKTHQQNFVNHPLPEAIALLVEDIHFFEFIAKQYDSLKQIERRKNDIMFFIESAERFVSFNKERATLQLFVEKLLLQDSQDREEELDEEDDDVRKNEVTLMTLHSSKGLEFNTVYLIGMEEETLPHKKTIEQGGDIGEERRLAYVGITRAQEKLFMTYCKERKLYGKDVARHPSRFLHQLEKEHNLYTSQDRTTFGHLSEEEAQQYKQNFFSNLIDNIDD